MAKQKCEVIDRKKIFENPILALFKIDKNPTFLSETSFTNNLGKKITIPKRLICVRNIPGGYVMINVYGARPDDAGKKLPAKFTLWEKTIKSLETSRLSKVYYFDAEITMGSKTNLSFAIRDTITTLESWAPCIKMTFNGKPPAYIGFAKRK
ncbi:hypothetical protein KKC83_00930 [Patescibacteria group bacterium]|nr:hypothetical protein [Candidatus Falkowbacteria bacterium]MBU3906471.1 hypothetical protein [Patescibacteria group bacterium]MBU4015727.1 hypothetical protein [Patescibacteria group bacterium]MBU4026093.1 hypothetical protein [Patescibacteria group bacterium]MBU4073679.1 hypothetical protein [Patescibacteria group bacterium]